MSVKKGISAGMWSATDIAVRQGLAFVVSIILARILSPSDFGIIAIVAFFTGLSAVFIDGGMAAALIQRKGTSRQEESAAFWWNLSASLILATVLAASGPSIAAFYGHAILKPLMYLAGAQLVLSALGVVQYALLSRALRFDRLTKVGILSSVIGGTVGVAAAFSGFGLWSLALQSVTAAAINSLSLWLLSDWRPTRHFRFQHIRRLLGFASWVGAAGIMDVAYTQGYSLLIGKLHGVSDLGLYNRAHGTQQMPGVLLSKLISRVAFPLFSQKADDLAAFRRGSRMATQIVMLLNVPTMVGLAMVSDLVVPILFGEKWMPAAPILSILAVSGMLFPMHTLNVQMMLARGDTSTYFKNEIGKKSLGIASVAIGSFFGIYGLAYSQVVYSILALVLNAQWAGRTINYGVLRQLADLRGIAVAAAMMSIAIFGVRHFLVLPPGAALCLCIATGIVTYFGTGLIIRSAVFSDGWIMIKSWRK